MTKVTPTRSQRTEEANESDTRKRNSSKTEVESTTKSSTSSRRRTRGNNNDDNVGTETLVRKEEEFATHTRRTLSISRSSIGGRNDEMPNMKTSDTENVASTAAAAKQKLKSSSEKTKVSSGNKKKSTTPTTPTESKLLHEVPVIKKTKSPKKKRSVEDDTTSSTKEAPTASLSASDVDSKISDDRNTETASTNIIKKPEPTLDVLVHRLRHLNYHPKPILAMASTCDFHHDDSVSADDVNQHAIKAPDSYLAISRESGCIELQTIHPKWRTLAIIAGHTSTPITLLTWIQSPMATQQNEVENEYLVRTSPQRPILVGVNGSDLYIVDFWNRQQLISKYACPGGNIFSLQHIYDNIIAIGSQDGTIRILSVVDMKFELLSTIPTAGAAVLSLACIANTRATTKHNELIGTILFAGVADGTIRRYDCHTSHNHQSIGSSSAKVTTSATVYFASSSAGVIWKSTLRMTVECYGRSTPTLVWTMKALSDGMVVSGDSLGHVQFWDGLTGTLICSFDQNDNKADVLALDVTSDECKVFTSGVDSRVVCIERRRNVTGSDNSKWIMTHAQRPHTHDVKAMTIMKKFKVDHSGKITKQTEILFTGGIDTKLCTYHVSEFGLRRPRSLYPWPSLHSPIVAANKARLLTMQREDHVDLYELATAPSTPKQLHSPIVASDERSLIGTIQVKGSSNLSCCAISDFGEFLALCDSYSLFLFHLHTETMKSGRRKVTASTIPVILPVSSSIVAMQFIQDSHLVLATSQSKIHIFTMVKNDNAFETSHLQTISPSNIDTDRLAWLLPIHSIMCSANGLWMATTRNSCDQCDGVVDIYRFVNDSFQFWWSLPTLNAAVTVASFLEPHDSPKMAVACVNFTWYIFDISQRCLSDWSVQAGYPLLTNKIPTDLAARNDYPIRIGTNPADPSVLFIGSFGAIVVVNTAEAFPKKCRIVPEIHVRGTKRKRSNSFSESNNAVSELSPSCTICLSYNSMLFMNFVANHEMVVVEQPWLNVVATFPGALHRKVYGT